MESAKAAGEIEDYSEAILPGKGASDYERYLRTDELLSLQKTPEEQAHRDELLFQTVHQSSELWLKLAAAETAEAAAVPTLGQAFSALVRKRELTLEDVYVHGREHEDLYQLAEALTELDERLMLWRVRHYKVVARIIGDEVVGTQGTPVELLGGLIKQTFFPELWAIRNRLTTRAISEGTP